MKQVHRLAALCLSAVLCISAGCQTIAEHGIPHPKRAEKSVHKQVNEVFDGLARTERDRKKIFKRGGFEDKGRLLLLVGGSGIGSELAMYLH